MGKEILRVQLFLFCYVSQYILTKSEPCTPHSDAKPCVLPDSMRASDWQVTLLRVREWCHNFIVHVLINMFSNYVIHKHTQNSNICLLMLCINLYMCMGLFMATQLLLWIDLRDEYTTSDTTRIRIILRVREKSILSEIESVKILVRVQNGQQLFVGVRISSGLIQIRRQTHMYEIT